MASLPKIPASTLDTIIPYATLGMLSRPRKAGNNPRPQLRSPRRIVWTSPRRASPAFGHHRAICRRPTARCRPPRSSDEVESSEEEPSEADGTEPSEDGDVDSDEEEEGAGGEANGEAEAAGAEGQVGEAELNAMFQVRGPR